MTTKTLTSEEVIRRIFKESGADPETLPVGYQVVWYGPPAADGRPSDPSNALVVRLGEDDVLFPAHKVRGIFHDEEEFRVYTLPGSTPKTPAEAMPRCVHLSKKGPVYFVEMMNAEAFITAMAADWSLLAYDMRPIDRERILIAEYLREKTADSVLEADRLTPEQLAESIESGEYADEDEEEEEEEPDEPETPPSPTGAPTPGVQ
jgi:hypothetical protein